jgi:alanyl-tRNA synthetase
MKHMKSTDVRAKFIDFYKKMEHVEIPSAPLIPVNDPTTLFTSSGMQPLVPYLLGQPHPSGTRLVDSQKSFRAQDIDEVGDNRHTTFFEMLGNWSLGDYFKKEQLHWIFEFLTQKLRLAPDRMYVSVFEGNDSVPKDTVSIELWQQIFREVGIDANVGERIFLYPATKNWWSRSGEPEHMPPGEPGGPDSEVFFDFGIHLRLHEQSVYKDHPCHPNCDCGRFMEIANSVFMQYKKVANGSLVELAQKNVDFGGGLERMTAASEDNADIFQTDLFSPIIRSIEEFTKKEYLSSEKTTQSMRVIADHLKAAVFMISEGLVPSNKQQGYVLRRLVRRSVVKMHELGLTGSKEELTKRVCQAIGEIYHGVYFQAGTPEFLAYETVLTEEIRRFELVLHKGLSELHKHTVINGKIAFDVLQSYGFPWELTYEFAQNHGTQIQKEEFLLEFRKHQDLSRTAAKGMFKGGLADHSEQTIKLHTAHHLLLASLQKCVDPSIKQRGSNITAERLRMDFNFGRKLTPEELQKVEAMVNEQIIRNVPVTRVEMDRADAEKIGAQMEFGTKYPDRVSVYFVGTQTEYFSVEFCGGPHVRFTGDIGHFTIVKEETLGAGIRRIYARVQ